MTKIITQRTDQPSKQEYDDLLEVLRTFTRAQVSVLDNHDYGLLLKDETGALLGGLIGQSRWGGFLVDILALSEELRGQGWGKRLLAEAETEARSRQCHHMRLDTYAFQAKTFYEAHGFEVYGQIDGPAPFYPHYFMMKKLI